MMQKLSNNGKSLKYRATLQLRLTALIVIAVLVVMSGGIALDYRREFKRHLSALLASLEEQARALEVASLRIKDEAEFTEHVNDFCAQMNEYISPGHHILVLEKTGEVTIRARHHSGPEVELALLRADSNDSVVLLGKHKLAQVRLQRDDESMIIVAQYLDHMEGTLRVQLISRSLFAGVAAIAIILITYSFVNLWVIRPVRGLADAAKKWAARSFSARAIPFGPAEFHFLANEFNIMSEQLEKHELSRIAELEQARNIQMNLLPASNPTVTGLTIAAEYRPAEHVAGDLYDIFKLADAKTAFAVLDVCGHGISAALLTGVVKMSLHRRLTEEDNLSRAMELVNSDLLSCVLQGRFVTACVGIWNSDDHTWTYCAAGHPGGMLVSNGRAQSLNSTAPLLGVLSDADWATDIIRLSSGSKLFLYSDGVVEAGVADGRMEDFDLEKTLLQNMDSRLIEQVAAVMAEATCNTTVQSMDDATIVAFEVLPEPVQ
jgi:HAMP domain-containing protein